MFGRFDVETTNDATLPFKNAGFKELPDCLFKILPNHLQKCQKTHRLAFLYSKWHDLKYPIWFSTKLFLAEKLKCIVK